MYGSEFSLVFAVSVGHVYLYQILSPHIFTETTVFVFKSLLGSPVETIRLSFQFQIFFSQFEQKKDVGSALGSAEPLR